MSVEDRRSVGSAEPLSAEETEVRLRELEAWELIQAWCGQACSNPPPSASIACSACSRSPKSCNAPGRRNGSTPCLNMTQASNDPRSSRSDRQQARRGTDEGSFGVAPDRSGAATTRCGAGASPQ